MLLSEKAIKDFQNIYENQLGKKISQEDAHKKGEELIRLVELIYKPITEKEFNLVQERRKQTGDI